MSNVNVSSTKSGPGRRHKQGVKKISHVKGPVGFGSFWLPRQAEPAKVERRALVKAIGIRQAKKLIRRNKSAFPA